MYAYEEEITVANDAIQNWRDDEVASVVYDNVVEARARLLAATGCIRAMSAIEQAIRDINTMANTTRAPR